MWGVMISSKINEKSYKILTILTKQLWVSKTSLIEQWIDLLERQYIKAKIKSSYKSLWKDQEIIELTEIWLEDFNNSYK